MAAQVFECPAEFEGKEPSLFLAGGITNCPWWQTDLIQQLEKLDIAILNPRRAVWPKNSDVSEVRRQIRWERRHLERASLVSFWFPKETLCPIVLFELGVWSMADKPIRVGCHPDYERRFDVEEQMAIARPDVIVCHSVDVLAAQIRVGMRQMYGVKGEL